MIQNSRQNVEFGTEINRLVFLNLALSEKIETSPKDVLVNHRCLPSPCYVGEKKNKKECQRVCLDWPSCFNLLI